MMKRSNDKTLQRYEAVTHPAEIIFNKSIGKDCFRMGLEIIPPWRDVIIPGQFIHLKLTPDFEPLLRRPFSIFNVPKTGPLQRDPCLRQAGRQRDKNEPSVIEIAYQVVGKGTRLMTQMKPGTKIDLLGPLGNGFTINKKAAISILVGGGLGTAALHLLLKSLLESNSAKDSHKIYNLIGARSKEEVYFADSFRQLEPNTMIATEDGSKGTKGLVTDLLTKVIRNLQSEISNKFIPTKEGQSTIQIYACGPKGMTKVISHIAALNKIPCQVSLEEWMGCGIGICRACVCQIKQGKSFRYATTCSEGPVFDSSQLYLEKL